MTNTQDELPIFVNTINVYNTVQVTIQQLMEVCDVNGDHVIDPLEFAILHQRFPSVSSNSGSSGSSSSSSSSSSRRRRRRRRRLVVVVVIRLRSYHLWTIAPTPE